MTDRADTGHLLGVVLLVRHGDRQGFYQDPHSYTPSATAITPLGNLQEYQLGQLLRLTYIERNSSSHIQGINDTIADQAQLRVRADAGGEGGVIFNSALSLLQGLYPATTDYTTRLANGTVVTGPLNGYQYIPIESVEPENDVSMEGWTYCNNFITDTNNFYASSDFQLKEADNRDFLRNLSQFLDGRPVTLNNMWNVFDFMNVQSIHNQNFRDTLPNGYLEKARDIINWREYHTFSSNELSGIGNIAGRTILPSIIKGLNNISNPDEPTKLVYLAVSYKPLLSLFKMTRVADQNPQLAGIVNYAAAVAVEVWQQSPLSEPHLRFNFKNGTEDSHFKSFSFFGSSEDVPLSSFTTSLTSAGINTTAEWCSVCSNIKERGCDQVSVALDANSQLYHQLIDPVGAGFLGAGLTLAIVIVIILVLLFMKIISIGSKKSKPIILSDQDSEHSSIKV